MPQARAQPAVQYAAKSCWYDCATNHALAARAAATAARAAGERRMAPLAAATERAQRGLVVVLERHLGLQARRVPPDGGHGQGLAAAPVGDGGVALGEVARHVDLVPALG